VAKGSEMKWGGWETRACWKCGKRLILKGGHAIHCQPAGGTPFSLCIDCMESFPEAHRASVAA
jgi:hypothetical protein